MPTRGKITIIGIYNHDNTIFDSLNVPEGMDKETAINGILIDNAEFELMYPDLDFMRMAIKNFSNRNAKKWEKLWKTETIEYNPIYNVDAEEKEIIDRDYTAKNNRDNDTVGRFAGFNSSGFSDVSQNDGVIKDDGEGTEDVITTKTRHGNIGVTMTQQMLEAERNVAEFSTYKVISDDFKRAFCVMVY